MENSIKNQSIKCVTRSATERFSVHAVQIVISIILACLVAPSEYGLISMLVGLFVYNVFDIIIIIYYSKKVIDIVLFLTV